MRGLRLDRLELAPGCTVHNIPSARPQLFADPVRRVEIALSAPLDSLGYELLGVILIRSFWL